MATQGVAEVHDFFECRARSHEAEDLPLWGEVYKQAFGETCKIISHRQDGDHQRAGIDRSIILSNSSQLLIDEKIRGRCKKTGKIYTDIALEYEHKYSNGRILPGWVCKPLRCHYIAYAIAPLGKCYLLPVPQLQKAWADNKEMWKKSYPSIVAFNRGYTSHSVGVPVDILFKAIGKALRLGFTPTEIEE